MMIDEYKPGVLVEILDPAETPLGWSSAMFNYVGMKSEIRWVTPNLHDKEDPPFYYGIKLVIDSGEWFWRPVDLAIVNSVNINNPNFQFSMRKNVSK